MGCARPSCFGWNASGKRSADPAQFYKIGDKVDGFIRSNDKQDLVGLNFTKFHSQYSVRFYNYKYINCKKNFRFVKDHILATVVPEIPGLEELLQIQKLMQKEIRNYICFLKTKIKLKFLV